MKLPFALLTLLLALAFSPEITRALDIVTYWGIRYPSPDDPPVLEHFIVKDGQLRLISVVVDTDGDFVLDSHLHFFDGLPPKLEPLKEKKGDPFSHGAEGFRILAPRQAEFEAAAQVDTVSLKRANGTVLTIDFWKGQPYFRPEDERNHALRRHPLYQPYLVPRLKLMPTTTDPRHPSPAPNLTP